MSITITEKEFLEKYPRVQENIAQQFIDYCKIHNDRLADSTIYLASRVFFNTEFQSTRVPVITLRMGLGKSTLINLYTKFMRENDSNYGSLIALEQINSLKEAQLLYPDSYALYGFRQEDCKKNLNFYNPNMCRVCNVSDCRIALNERYVLVSPILMITHARLNLIMQDKRALSDIMYFYSDIKRNHQFRRFDLFVDECPGFFTVSTFNEKAFTIFQNALHQTFRRDCKQRRELINYFKDMIILYRKILLEDGFKGFVTTPSILSNTELFSDFLYHKKIFMMNYYGDYYHTCVNVLNAIHQGGYINNHVLTSPRENELLTGDHRTIILDGTATLNSSYPNNCIIIDFPDKRLFPRVTWNLNPHHNTAKEYYHTHPDFIPKIKDTIVEALQKHNKILIITFKYLEDVYRKYFTKEQLEHIYIDHFNNLKGKNHYRDATCLFYLGTIYKGDIYYLFYYKYCKKLNNEEVNIENIEFRNVSSQRIPFNKELNVIDNELFELINKDKAEALVQDGFRINPREYSDSITDYYVFSTNIELESKIHEFFPGCTINKVEMLKAESPEYERFMTELNKFKDDESQTKISKSELRERTHIFRNTLTNYLKDPFVIGFLQNANISISRYYLEKSVN